VTFGFLWRAGFSVKRFKPRASRGAPEQGRKNRPEEGVQDHLSSSETSGLGRRHLQALATNCDGLAA
jgi:hypothetical protein